MWSYVAEKREQRSICILIVNAVTNSIWDKQSKLTLLSFNMNNMWFVENSKKEIYNYSINKPKNFVENFIPFHNVL